MKKIAMIISVASLAFVACRPAKPAQRIEFLAPDAYPEGVVYDKNADVYYVSSVRSGTIGKVTPSGQYSVLYADSNLKSTYGLKIFPDGKKLYACVSDANYSKFSSPATKKKMMHLICIDLASGAKTEDFDLGSADGQEHFANDIAFDPLGNAYVTDSYSDMILKVEPSGKTTVFSNAALFKTRGVGPNGIVYHPAGFFLVACSGKGSLYKVSYLNPSQVQRVKTNGFFMGMDGLLLNDSTHLTLVVNGGTDKIMQLQSKDDWQSAELVATTKAEARFAYPSTATANGADIWVMNAKFNELADTATIKSNTFFLQKAELKPVPKKYRNK